MFIDRDILSKTPEELKEILAGYNEPGYRAVQIFHWLHRKKAGSFSEMTDLPAGFREKLQADFSIFGAKIEKKLVSCIDDTVKYLLKLFDGELVEAVLMKYRHGYSMCISTQGGCKMGCSFCATGMGGFTRNLTASEMLSQIYAAEKDMGVRVSNIVLMGMGEPLDNFDNTIGFLELVSHKEGANLSLRHVTLSTCGIVDKIYELAKFKFPLTLSVSLHAPFDEVRTKLMPVNKKWGICELIEACKTYIDMTKRRISFEYALIDEINDSDECALQLSRILKGMLCHVNLIPANAVSGKDHKKSSKERMDRFKSILEKGGLNVTIRRTLGADINASCGQLRGRRDFGEVNFHETIG